MKKSIIIIIMALLVGQNTKAQELSKTTKVLDSIHVKSDVPQLTVPTAPWNMPHSQQPYSTSVAPVLNNSQPSFLNDSLLSRGSKDPLQTVAPLKGNGNYNAQSMMTLGGWNIVGASGMTSMPGMMNIGSAAIGLNRSFGNLTINVSAGANRYRANIMDNPVLAAQGIHSMSTQYGIGGSLSLRLNDYWSITAYGQYHNRNPYFFMAAFPYVHTSTYGAYATYTNGWFGMDMGTRRYYDAFGRRWITEPIVHPEVQVRQ